MTSIQYVKFALVSLVRYNVYMDIIKEELVEKLKKYFFDEFEKTLENTELDDEEKLANRILSRKKIILDAENIADLVFKVYE